MPRTYVYELALPDEMGGLVFYVGQGQGDRISQHEYDAMSGAVGARFDVIRGVWAMGFQITKRKVLECDTQIEALSKERELITRYGLDRLTNQRAGVDINRSAPTYVTHYNLPFLKLQLEQMQGRPYSWGEIARDSDLSIPCIMKIVNRGVTRVDLDTIAKLVNLLRRKGINVKSGDLLVDVPVTEAA